MKAESSGQRGCRGLSWTLSEGDIVLPSGLLICLG